MSGFRIGRSKASHIYPQNPQASGGRRGPQGSRGAQGETGSTGGTGATGAAGASGLTGGAGSTGSTAGNDFASNFAVGPAAPQTITSVGINVNWTADVGGSGASVNIKPAVTGRLHIFGVVGVDNLILLNAAPTLINIFLLIDGVTQPIPLAQTNVQPITDSAEIPFDFTVTVPLGNHLIGIFAKTINVNASATIPINTCAMSIEELPAATA